MPRKRAARKAAKPARPKLAGIWVLACTPQGELIKWGANGDTEKPFTPSQKKQALADSVR